MPYHFIDAPPIEVEKKRALCCEITDAMERAYGIPARPSSSSCTTPSMRTSRGGTLLCDRH